MNLRPLLVAVALVGSTAASALFAAAAKSDLLPPQRRQASVDLAEKLAQRATPPPVDTDVLSPFNPANFEQAPPSARGPGTPGIPGGRPPGTSPQAPGGAPAAAPAPGDREILETLASRLPSAATAVRDGKPLLVMGRDRFEVGTRFIVTYNEQDYELELVAIDRTTFTLRYRSEEYTRPIRPVK